MSACNPNSAPWCGPIHELDPDYLLRLTPEQAELYLQIAETGVRLLRDDLPLNNAIAILGSKTFQSRRDHVHTYTRPELQGVKFVITLVDSGENSNSVKAFEIRVRKRLDGVRKQDLEERLELQRASDYVAFSLDPRTDVDFSYEVGLDAVSCYPVWIGLNFFKDEAYATIDPRADQEAKYLGPVIMRRSFMTPEEEMERARRVPQCRSREPAPRSGLWKPTISHDVPNAEYFKRQETLAYRVNKGQLIISVGLGSPEHEARVWWAWIGK